jgi:hypothetical protein
MELRTPELPQRRSTVEIVNELRRIKGVQLSSSSSSALVEVLILLNVVNALKWTMGETPQSPVDLITQSRHQSY